MGHLIPSSIAPFVLPVVYAVVIVAVLPLLAGYIVLLERKVMADMQARLGPMRVGPHGLLQPIADAVKLLLKEDIIPEKADKFMFWMAPLVSVTMALLAYSALPIGPAFQIADLNVGLLFILGDQLARNLRHRTRRLGVQQPLFAARRDAQRRATGQLRNCCGPWPCLRAAARGHALDEGNRAGAIRPGHLVYFCRARRILHLHGRLDRGNQSRALRSCPKPNPNSSRAT